MRLPVTPLSSREFTILLAVMISIVAMSTDVVLPALGVIAADLGVPNPNDAQLVVSVLFLGFAVGQALAGPLSDSFGRRPVILVGYGIFIAGCVMSMLASDWNQMLIGRVLQGFGAAMPRIVTVALVRDGYEGRAMARIMSVVFAIFVLVPCIAPAVGQGMMYLGGWPATFASLIALALVGSIWFALRQPETLPPPARRPFSIRSLWAGMVEILRTRTTIGYTCATAMIFGAFLGYLSSAQQIFQVTYDTGDMFAIYFGVAALAIGGASVANSMLVMRLGMRFLSFWAIAVLCAGSLLFCAFAAVWGGVPPFVAFMAWLMGVFFCIGLLFGNLNAIAMEPLGHIAGLGAALVGSLSTLLSLPLGWGIGQMFAGTILPLVAGFGVLGAAGLSIIVLTERGTHVWRLPR